VFVVIVGGRLIGWLVESDEIVVVIVFFCFECVFYVVGLVWLVDGGMV